MFQALSFVKEGLIFNQCGKLKISYVFTKEFMKEFFPIGYLIEYA